MKQKAFRRAWLCCCLTVLIAGLSLMAGCTDAERGAQSPAVNKPSPAFEMVDTGGKTWKLSELRGTVVLLNFWATWCPSCVDEMPSLNNLNVLASSAPGFQILTVLYQDSPERADEYFRQEGFAMPVLTDKDSRAARLYGLTGVPETFIIDKKGILRQKFIGPGKFDTPEMVQFLNRLLEEPS